MMTMPAASLERMSLKCTGSPWKMISPVNVPEGCTPESTFIRVDLPAPFSPQMAWICPANTLMETSDRALIPGNSLVMETISRMAWLVDIGELLAPMCAQAHRVLTSLTSLQCRTGLCRVKLWRPTRDVTVHIGRECALDEIAVSNWHGHA